MRIAISVPDEVFEAGEHLARQLGISRSQLYSDALATYLNSEKNEYQAARLNALYGVQPSEIEPAIQRAQLSSTSRR